MVAVPQLDLSAARPDPGAPRPDISGTRPGSARSRGDSGLPRPGSSSARGPSPGPGGGTGILPGFRQLAFDSARGSREHSTERERLRNKLVDVGHRFVGFDKVVEDDTTKRRQCEVQRLATAQEGLAKLEKAMNSEIKRRVDSNKQVQFLTEQMANDMLERLQSNIMARIEKLAASIESLTL